MQFVNHHFTSRFTFGQRCCTHHFGSSFDIQGLAVGLAEGGAACTDPFENAPGQEMFLQVLLVAHFILLHSSTRNIGARNQTHGSTGLAQNLLWLFPLNQRLFLGSRQDLKDISNYCVKDGAHDHLLH